MLFFKKNKKNKQNIFTEESLRNIIRRINKNPNLRVELKAFDALNRPVEVTIVAWPPIQDNDVPSNRIMTINEGDILSIWKRK